jgi:MoaA/NifB/PqqE/SkfB family radical SAM enzyme
LPKPQEELTLEEIERIAKGMDDLMFLLPTGGEPFLRNDLAEIVKIFYRETNVRNVGIPTNGTLTERTVEFVNEVMSTCPEIDLGIDVSIDAVGGMHDSIRGQNGLFNKAINTYRELRQLEEKYHNFNVNVETTISSYNEDNLIELYGYLTQKLGVKTIFTLLTRGSPRELSAKYFNIEKYGKYARILEEGIKNKVLTGYDNFPFCDVINAERIVRHRLIYKIAKENRYQIPCMAGRLGAAIFPNADVLACELLTGRVMGNLRDFNYDFKKIWFSERAQNLRDWIWDSKCFCTYECFHTLNILFNIKMYPQVAKEWFSIKQSKIFKRISGENIS